MNHDRGMIKWQPFDSIVSSQNVLKSLIHEKEKQKKPILSEEEIKELEVKIIGAYFEQIDVNLKYYKNGYINNIKGKIKKIDHVQKIIYFNNLTLFFNQILAID